jgi:hypothetical protein
MDGQYYKGVALDDKGTREPVNYVGVHPLVWHDHPEQPEMGFSEIDDIPPSKEDLSVFANMIKLAIMDGQYKGVSWSVDDVIKDFLKSRLKY